jgi:hypothetical protein
MYGVWFCTIYVQCLSNLHILRYRIALSRTPKPTRSPSPWRVGPPARRRTAGARRGPPFNSIPSLNMCCECDVRAESARVREDE